MVFSLQGLFAIRSKSCTFSHMVSSVSLYFCYCTTNTAVPNATKYTTNIYHNMNIMKTALAHTHTHTHTHTFNGPLSGTTRVSQYQKGKTNLDFTGATDSEWQWHQLGHMQVCTSLQTDNHASTPPLCFLQAGCPSCHPTNSVKLSRHTKPSKGKLYSTVYTSNTNAYNELTIKMTYILSKHPPPV